MQNEREVDFVHSYVSHDGRFGVAARVHRTLQECDPSRQADAAALHCVQRGRRGLHVVRREERELHRVRVPARGDQHRIRQVRGEGIRDDRGQEALHHDRGHADACAVRPHRELVMAPQGASRRIVRRPRGHPVCSRGFCFLTLFPSKRSMQPHASFTWRRSGDSNSGSRSPQTNDLANRPLQPLGYSSVLAKYPSS